MIDKDLHLARALLVEGNPLLRSVAAGQLRKGGDKHSPNAKSWTDRVKDLFK